MDAPEEKWLAHNGGLPTGNYPKSDLVRYVRGDVHEALIREAEARGMERALGIMKTAGDSAVTEALGQRLCCNGQDCGCRGATVEEYLEHLIRAEVAAIRGETP